MAKLFVGLDWSETHHDVFIEDDDGRRVDSGRVPEGVEGVARFHAMVAEQRKRTTLEAETDTARLRQPVSTPTDVIDRSKFVLMKVKRCYCGGCGFGSNWA